MKSSFKVLPLFQLFVSHQQPVSLHHSNVRDSTGKVHEGHVGTREQCAVRAARVNWLLAMAGMVYNQSANRKSKSEY